MRIAPQPGPQEMFLSTSADIAIYGGSAGGGKTFAILLEPLRHIDIPGFGGVIFRRESPQIRNEGGLWDESMKLYPYLGARAKESILQWQFPAGPKLKFSHLQYDDDVLNWQGSQVPFIGFDELTHFTKKQFFYMLSRNRSTCGVRPYVRSTTNPDADSWVAELISWWIDQDTGLPIPERSGVIRWFIHKDDILIWADSKEELEKKYGQDCFPKSLTFIAANIYDNKILLEKDPGYLANLNALSFVERSRLLGGNWKVRPSAGLFFSRSYFEIVDAVPANRIVVRSWDLAATKKTPTNDPDLTASVLISKDEEGFYYIEHFTKMQESPGKVKEAIINLASQDGKKVHIHLSQDPGQAGKAQVDQLTRELAGYIVKSDRETGDKVTRASPMSAQAERGNIKILRGAWNDEFLSFYEQFPDGRYKDPIDAGANGFNYLTLLTVRRPQVRSL